MFLGSSDQRMISIGGGNIRSVFSRIILLLKENSSLKYGVLSQIRVNSVLFFLIGHFYPSTNKNIDNMKVNLDDVFETMLRGTLFILCAPPCNILFHRRATELKMRTTEGLIGKSVFVIILPGIKALNQYFLK